MADLEQSVAASHDMPAVRLAIVILTWRGEEQTRECLAGLTRLWSWPIPTLVIDNASGTGEGERLAAEFGPPVEALTRPVNDGVPGGYNAGLAWGLAIGATHVLLLNNDTVIDDPLLLDRLAAALRADVAAVGPIVRDPDGTIFSAGGWMDWLRGRGRFWQAARSASPYEVEWLDGPCLLVSTEVARQVGGLAPDYFMYWEELDWEIRAGRLGYKLLVQPATAITHARSTRDASMRVRYLMLRNGILFMRRHGTTAQNATSLAWAIGYKAPGMAVRCLGRPRDLLGVPGTVFAAFAWNIADAWRRRRWRLPADGPEIGGSQAGGSHGARAS